VIVETEDIALARHTYSSTVVSSCVTATCSAPTCGPRTATSRRAPHGSGEADRACVAPTDGVVVASGTGGGAMSDHTELFELEREGWNALTTSREAAAAYYERALARQILMLLPGGMVIDQRSKVIESMRTDPWDEFELSDERVLSLGEECAVVAYRARARRGDMDYEALFNSTYVHEDGSWRLALHQQTPIG
jgi:Domain of unknown function (DUF4440)